MKKRITRKQAISLPLLAAGTSGVETAKIIGVKPSTVSVWLNHNPEFILALNELRDEGVRQAIDQLQGTLSLAVEEFRRIMTTSKSDTLRLKAAQFIIETYGTAQPLNYPYLDIESNEQFTVISGILKNLGIHNAK